MNLEQAANFFTGSILMMLGFVVITMGIVAINNILHRFWKPVQMFKFLDHAYTPRFMTSEEEAAAKHKKSVDQ
jgi:hypothetical protein